MDRLSSAPLQVSPEFLFGYILARINDSSIPNRYAGCCEDEQRHLRSLHLWREIDALASFGGHLGNLHARGGGFGGAVSYPVKGDNVIEEVRYQAPQATGADQHTGRVWINGRQYFEGIAEAVWTHPIGGYRPAERWLKDRRGRTLSYDDKEAYPRLVTALGETRRLMGDIDACITAHGGWPGAFA